MSRYFSAVCLRCWLPAELSSLLPASTTRHSIFSGAYGRLRVLPIDSTPSMKKSILNWSRSPLCEYFSFSAPFGDTFSLFYSSSNFSAELSGYCGCWWHSFLLPIVLAIAHITYVLSSPCSLAVNEDCDTNMLSFDMNLVGQVRSSHFNLHVFVSNLSVYMSFEETMRYESRCAFDEVDVNLEREKMFAGDSSY